MSVLLKGFDLWAVCDRCGAKKALATGYISLAMTFEKLDECWKKLGWDTSKKMLVCDECARKNHERNNRYRG